MISSKTSESKRFLQFISSFILLWVLLFSQSSCTHTDSVDMEVDITKAMETNAKLMLSDYCDSIYYIQPEYVPEAIPGSYRKVELVNDRVIIVDTHQRIFIYTTEGKLLTYINKKGRGPGEYINILSITAIDDYIYFIDNDEYILKYSMAGEFIKRIRPDARFLEIKAFNGQLVLYTMPPFTIQNKGKRISIYDTDLNELKKVHPAGIEEQDIDPGQGVHAFINLYEMDGALAIFEKGINKIYKMSPDFRIQEYLDLILAGSEDATADEQFTNIKLPQIDAVYETNSYLYIEGSKDAYRKTVLYSKADQSGVNLVFNYDIIDSGFTNDIDGGYPFWPREQSPSGLLYTWFNPIRFSLKFQDSYFDEIRVKHPDLKKAFRTLMENADDTTNPVIMVVCPK